MYPEKSAKAAMRYSPAMRASAFFPPRLNPILDGGKRHEDPVIPPEVPRGGSGRQSVLDDQADGEGNHPVCVTTPREGHIGHVSVEIQAAEGAVMLRIEEVNLVGLPRHQIPHVVQPPGKAPQAGSSFAAPRAGIAFVVTTANEDSRCRQVFNTSDSLCYIGKVFTGARHHSVLQSSRSSPGYTGKFWLSMPEKLCIFATVSKKATGSPCLQ
jgi:hypothetical protein